MPLSTRLPFHFDDPDDSNVAPEDPVSYPKLGDPSSDSDSSVGNSSLEARSHSGSPDHLPRGRTLVRNHLHSILDEPPLSPIRSFPRRRRYTRISRFDVISCSSSSSSDDTVYYARSFSRSPSPLGPRLPPSPRSSSPSLPVWKKPRFESPAFSDSEDDESGTVYVLPSPKRRSPRRRVTLQSGNSSKKADEMFVLFGPPMTSSDSDLDDEKPVHNV